MMRLSQCVLLAHEDKIFQGAFVASLSIPWGDTKDDRDRGGYHLVWTRDMVQTAIALLAIGQTESALRALIWLACVQGADGSLPQNSSITGEPYWKGMQLDEVAAPILLAWRLEQAAALRQFDPWTLVSRAVRYLILNGPVTAQERWEENSGYSPSTLATIIASVAMPLCWAHAEYITLVRSRKDGVCFERIGPVYDRYVKNKLESRCEIWTFAHQLRSIPSGKTLRIIAGAPVTVRWSSDGWASTHDTEAVETSLGCWFVDLPWESLETAREIVFTFHWPQTWEGKDFRVQIGETPETRG